MDSSGDLFGTTLAGGDANGDGTIFEVVKGSGVLKTLAQFNGTNGSSPTGPLSIDSAGNIYGSTEFGGTNGDGRSVQIGQVEAASSPFLTSFNSTVGLFPGGVIADSAGNLYGAVIFNGNSVLFELPKGEQCRNQRGDFQRYRRVRVGLGPARRFRWGSIRNLPERHGVRGGQGQQHHHDAGQPHLGPRRQALGAALTIDTAGNIYGASFGGGTNGFGDGTVFELSPASSMAPARLAFATPPSMAVAGAILNPAIAVSVEDADGNVVAGDNSTVTLTIASGPPGATLGGTVKAGAMTINGVATFPNLYLDQVGPYTLKATDGDTTLAPATSNSFFVVQGAVSGYYTPSVLANLHDSNGGMAPMA